MQNINEIKANISSCYNVLGNMGATMPEEQNSENLTSTISSISTDYKYGFSVDDILKDKTVNGVIERKEHSEIRDEAERQIDLYFSGIKKIASCYILDGQKEIGIFGSIFSRRGDIQSVIFPDLEDIEQYGLAEAFRDCEKISAVRFPKLKTVSGGYAFTNAFYNNPELLFVDLSALETISSPVSGTPRGGEYGCSWMFLDCEKLSRVDLSSLKQTDGCLGMFKNCIALTQILLPELTTISGTFAAYTMFDGCTALATVSLPNLTTIIGEQAGDRMFAGCTSLQSISFPSLINVSGTNVLNQMFSGSTSLREIHFRADAQSTISSQVGYSSRFGATNATIYFDL